MENLNLLLKRLLEAKIDFVLIGGYSCKVISLDDLITAKEKMKRPKDLLVLDELKAVRQREAEKKR